MLEIIEYLFLLFKSVCFIYFIILHLKVRHFLLYNYTTAYSIYLHFQHKLNQAVVET